MRPIDRLDARARLFLVVAASYLVIALLLPFSKIAIDFGSFVKVYAIVNVLIAYDLIAASRRASRTMAALDVLIAGSLAITPILVSTYLAIGAGMPLADERLIAGDAALGFDWRAFIAFVDARPALATALSFAYKSFIIQLSVIPVYFAARGQGVRAASIVTAYVILCFACSAVSVWFPALGTYVAYGVGPGDVVNIDTRYCFFFLDSFHAVRDQAAFTLTDGKAAGILTFPSVHAGVAAVCAWGAWSDRCLRYPLLVLNVAMATAAISHASHYLVDVIAGVAVAAVAIAASKALFYRREPATAAAPDLVLAPAR